MISYEDALSLVLSQAKLVKTHEILTQQAFGQILAEKIVSPIALPSFNNSAMDGYALRSDETKMASKAAPCFFDKRSTVGAGELSRTTFQSHQTIEIMTGAPLPDAFDAVVPIEKITSHTEGAKEQIGISFPLQKGENVRYKGDDIDAGQVLLSKGTRLTHEMIMTLSGVGIHSVNCFQRPRILILPTGKELSVHDKPKLDHQIFDCNSPYLSSRLEHNWGATVHVEPLLTDTVEPFCDCLQQYLNQYPDLDIIISTGAVSAGKYDFIPSALARLGAKTVFHKIAIRPGKPVLFATLPNGTLFFGLPGNPSAVACGTQFLIEPFLCKQRERVIKSPDIALLDSSLSYKKPLCFFQKAHHYIDEQAISRVEILSGQASFKIAPFLKANSWVKIDTAPTTLNQGDEVKVYPMTFF